MHASAGWVREKVAKSGYWLLSYYSVFSSCFDSSTEKCVIFFLLAFGGFFCLFGRVLKCCKELTEYEV